MATIKYNIGQIRAGFQVKEGEEDIINTSTKKDLNNPGESGIWYKLGIQAPSGSRWEINGNKTILIGRTGMYELDDDIIVKSIKFVDGPFADVIIDYLEGASNQ